MRTATRRLLLFGSANGVRDPDARAYGTAVGLLTTDPRLKLIETLIVALKTAGVWTLLDRLWLFAAQNSTQALTDLVTRASATAINLPTLTADRGYAGNGTTSYVNTNFAPLTNGVQFTQNSAHLSLYNRTNRTTSSAFETPIGAEDGADTKSSIICLRPSGSPSSFIEINSSSAASATVPTAQGSWTSTRTGPLAGDQALYRNGAALTLSGTAASTGVTAFKIYVGGSNRANTLVNAVTDQNAAASMGAGLSSAQAAARDAAINSYMTSIGANVY